MSAPMTYRSMTLSWNIFRLCRQRLCKIAVPELPSTTSACLASVSRLCTASSVPVSSTDPPRRVNRRLRRSPEAHYEQQFDPQLVKSLTSDMSGDTPVPMPNPFGKKYKKCLLCEKDIDVSWKNIRLLSQFVSPYTGRIYGRQITGLCIPMQKRIAKLVKRARYFGYMPFMNKIPEYMADPKLFDPFRPGSR